MPITANDPTGSDTLASVQDPDTTPPDDILVAAQPAAAQAAAAGAPSRIVFIDPTAPDHGDGSEGAPLDSWSDVVFEAGTAYLQRGGTTSTGFTVSGQGSADAPITIGSYGDGVASIAGSVVIDGASHVIVTGLDITGGQGLGVYVTGASTHVTLQDNTVHDGLSGIYIDSTTIDGLVVAGNRVHDNDTNGIWINGAVATAADPALITGNTVYRNGESGITLHASHVTVDGNSVVNNGLSGLAGNSGIHVFGLAAGDGLGRMNTITNNLVANQHEPDSFDGHGIQLDHFAGENVVTGNRIIGNDGPGITLYSADSNTVAGNHLEGNGADRAGSRDGMLAQAEIYVANAGWTGAASTGNQITGNTIVTTVAGTHAIVVTDGAEAAANVLGDNAVTLGSGSGGFAWGQEDSADLAAWNAFSTADGLQDSLAAPPAAAAPAIDAALLGTGYDANSTLFTTPASDAPNRLVAAGAGTLTGGSAIDRLAGDDAANRIEGLGSTDYLGGGGGNDTLLGGLGDDMLGGGVGNDFVYGGAGGDVITGGIGNDRLFGEAGEDWLSGGAGTDRLVGGAGFDALTGGAGADVFVATNGMGGDLIFDFTDGADRIDVVSRGITGLGQMVIVGGTEATLISFGGEDLMVLLDIAPAQLGAADFIFA